MEREKLYAWVQKEVENHLADKKWQLRIISELQDKGMPVKTVTNILSTWEDAQNLSDDIVITIAYAMNPNNSVLSKEDKELAKKWKMEKSSFKWPIRFNAVQLAPDQWLGVTTVNQLQELWRENLIKYDPEAQRPLERKVIHGQEVFKISINQSAVAAIQQSFHDETYIPNVITFNIPSDIDLEENEKPSRFTYEFDKERGLSFLKIDFVEHLSITDGYHRFVAMEREKNLSADFDYPMGIMITNFPVNREQQFIWQEDQKTQMSKVASNALNQNNPATQIVERMKADTSFILHDLIKRNGGVVSAPVLNSLISALFANKDMSRSSIVALERELKSGFETMVEQDFHILDEPWDWRFLCCMVVCMSNNDYDLEHVNKMFDEVHKRKVNGDPANLDKRAVTRFTKIYNELF